MLGTDWRGLAMRGLRIFATLVLVAVATYAAGMRSAAAGVLVQVDLSRQVMTVSVDGTPRYRWAISSARAGYVTPNGVYRPQRLARSWYSRKYGGAMPYSVFFRGGYAIHGTTAVGALGRPASHGCIRLHPAHAATLFSLVQSRGGTRIVITGSRPGAYAKSRRKSRQAVRRPRPRVEAAMPAAIAAVRLAGGIEQAAAPRDPQMSEAHVAQAVARLLPPHDRSDEAAIADAGRGPAVARGADVGEVGRTSVAAAGPDRVSAEATVLTGPSGALPEALAPANGSPSVLAWDVGASPGSRAPPSAGTAPPGTWTATVPRLTAAAA